MSSIYKIDQRKTRVFNYLVRSLELRRQIVDPRHDLVVVHKVVHLGAKTVSPRLSALAALVGLQTSALVQSGRQQSTERR